ncbi:hypothetical protein AB0M45_00040 [Nocardia sp. NPDC051787]|uniref:hypothetical protein n=1 Tax=Nocardia sp. NPDC051787 TaxID=3155415 RepID=UPI0034314198
MKILTATARHKTYESAAAALELGLNDLCSILTETEADLGQHLLRQLGSTTRVRLTDHGHEVISAMHTLVPALPH